ncbi:MAG TPA: glucose 1-dehydrogenase [Ktedonobacterales bacterium]|nr:glucose 1-dehydrogenase [Ktedonobacterales bacterium]
MAQQKVAIVTGGSLGIGAAIVRRLAHDGYAVTLDFHTHSDAANAIAQDITGQGGQALVVQADVSNVRDIANLVTQTVAHFGRLDLLVNNAGIEQRMDFLETAEAAFDRQIAVDLKGPYFAAQAAARQMVAQGGGGCIINISSVHEDLPMVGNAVYCAAKGGLRMLARTLANELAPHGIRIVNIGPGAVATPINAATLADPAKVQALLAEIPLKRVGQPDDVANAVAWLASDQASYITGTTLFVDGGLMIYAGSL